MRLWDEGVNETSYENNKVVISSNTPTMKDFHQVAPATITYIFCYVKNNAFIDDILLLIKQGELHADQSMNIFYKQYVRPFS